MATKENKVNNVKANNVNESAKVDNVENNEQNASDNATTNATNESKQEATTAPTSEQIASAKVEQKHMTEIANRYTLDEPKEVERTKFAGAYVMGVWRVDKTKHTKKDGDKTFFKIYFNGTIYDGYTATEFCDAVGIERKHRAGNAPKVTTMLDKLQALKNAIEAVGSNESDFVNFAKIVAKKIESEQLESERSVFVAKYGEAIALFDMITEATFAKRYNSDDLALAKKLGYKFSDTTDTTDTTESK